MGDPSAVAPPAASTTVATSTPRANQPVLRQVLGSDFERLHPKLREQYDHASADKRMFHGEGVAEYVRRDIWFVPFLYVGSKRRIMFPETGRDVPVTVRNYTYVDRFGREAITWTRDYKLPKVARRFDEVMIVTEDHRPIMYAGTHHHLAVDMELRVGAGGELLFRSGGQRLFLFGRRIVFPMAFSGRAIGCERYNEVDDRFEVDVKVVNRVWGTIFAYRAWFRGQILPCHEPPDDVRPLREEARW